MDELNKAMGDLNTAIDELRMQTPDSGVIPEDQNQRKISRVPPG